MFLDMYCVVWLPRSLGMSYALQKYRQKIIALTYQKTTEGENKPLWKPVILVSGPVNKNELKIGEWVNCLFFY